MPPLETSDRWQTATLWEYVGKDRFGQPKVSSTPRELDVRWNTTRRLVLAPDGNRVSLEAEAVVNRKVGIGSVLFNGDLTDWTGTGSGSAGEESELWEVVTYDETPDLKGRNLRREIGLKKYRDTLPTLG